MRRNKTPEGNRVVSFRVVPVLLAGCAGYLLGSAHIEAFRVADMSAAQAVAERFPQDWKRDLKDVSFTASVALRTAAVKLHAPASASVSGVVAAGSNAELALLDPEPMAPSSRPDPDPNMVPQAAAVLTASADPSAPVAAPPQLAARKAAQTSAAAVPAPAVKVAAVVPRAAPSERPGYILNDAQIASIKERLHLTPEQEQMWPAVEVALRNMAYTHPPQLRGRGAPTGETQAAAVDPNAVQGLKSAAVPLILSFNAEQKDEVRNLVHVMGLDQLASQF
jgi:hypothetical protein